MTGSEARPPTGTVSDLLAAFGLVLVIEGLAYFAAPDGMRRAMALLQTLPSATLRRSGLVMAVAGLVVVWLMRG